MNARIFKLSQLSKERNKRLNELEANKKDSMSNEQKNRRAEKINQLIAAIPVRFRDKTFNNYFIDNDRQALVKRLLERFVSTFHDRIQVGTSIKLMGNSGTGKTMLSLLMYQAIAKMGFSVKYEPSLEFLKTLLETKFKSQTSFNNYINELNRVQFLILDEVTESMSAKGFPSEIEKQLLLHIINSRYQEKLCTLVISNRDHEDLVKRLGVPIVDRLTENGISVAFNWSSYRQQ